MSFNLYVDKNKWLAHLHKMNELFPGYLPVIKGNGYGFGNSYLAKTALDLGKDRVAVGTLEEARSLVGEGFEFAELLVLTPVLSELRPEDFANCVFTVGSLHQLEHLLQSAVTMKAWGQEAGVVRVVIKCQSSMRRYGFSKEDMAKAAALLGQFAGKISLEITGYALHFPLEGLVERDKLSEAAGWVEKISELGLGGENFYISHLTTEGFRTVQTQHPNYKFVMRLGTALWLNEKSAYFFRSVVLEVQEIRRGQVYGYKQKRAGRNGYLLYVAGGSANGVGLEAPLHIKSFKDRLKLTAFWLLNLFNLNLSPYTYQGKRLWFAEPPHMQTTVLKLPEGTEPPSIGEELGLKNLRMTIAHFDRIVEVTPDNQETQVFVRNSIK